MSLTYYRSKPDLRAGFVLIAVFTIGMLGASLAAALNGGEAPQTITSDVRMVRATAPM